MPANTILPDPHVLEIEKVISEPTGITIVARGRGRRSICPQCGQAGQRVQSRYQRVVRDVPWQGVRVNLHLTVRRFWCDEVACLQRIFTERLPTVVAHYGRQTARLEALIQQFGVAAGGNPGIRLLHKLAVPVSRQTVLRRVRALPAGAVPPVRILGVDDFAFKRGQRYGTILVDHERQAVIDLLPDREAASLTAWLKTHPEVEIITRDRSHAYAAGATAGAPQAVQVADRFHLSKNATDVLERILDREQSVFRKAAEQVRGRQVADVLPVAGTAAEPVLAPIQALNQQRREEREATRRQRFDQVRALYRQGATIHRIAQQLLMHRRDVRRFIRAEDYPQRSQARKRGNQLDPFLPYLQQRWEEGCHTASVLYREIQAAGYRGCESALRHRIGRWKAGLPPEFRRSQPMNFKVAQALFTQPSVQRIVWLVLDPRIEPTESETWFLEEVRQASPLFHKATTAVLAFQALVRERNHSGLESWLGEAEQGTIPELKTFAAGLRQDLPAVQAALAFEWSNGRVEGAVHRLKLIKRSMFGRATFPLLKARTIQPEK